MLERSKKQNYEFGEFRLDAAKLMLYKSGREILLPRKAVETLLALVERRGEIVGKDELMEILWADSNVEEANLSQYIYLLRKTLGENDDGKPFIETFRRRGYRFAAVPTNALTDLLNKNSEKDFDENLIGRENEIDEIIRLIKRRDVHILTLSGIGGVGKTTLAEIVARLVKDDFPDGVFFVELASVGDPAMVMPSIAAELGIKEAGGKTIFETVSDFLQTREILLIIDNFEHLISAAADIIKLVRTAERLKILITSRVLLHLKAEREFIVPPLSIPSEIKSGDFPKPIEAAPVLPEELSTYEAIRLFTIRAENVKSSFALTDENAAIVAEICLRLDGVPLAIELAAARVKIMSPSAILKRLENQLNLLTGGGSDLPARQQTMRTTIGWSYDLLDENEKILFRRLAVFAGNFSIEAAEVVGEDDEIKQNILDIISSVVDKSLLVSKERADGEIRFRMLEVVREFALEVLEANGETEETCRRHAAYFLALVVEAEPFLKTAQSAEWLTRLEFEHDNIRRALRWALRSDAKLGQKLVGAMWRFWWLHGHIREGCDWLDAFLPQTRNKKMRIKMLLGVASLNRLRGNFDLTRSAAEETLALCIETNDKKNAAFSSYQLGMLALDEEDFDKAGRLFEDGLQFARESDDKQVLAFLLNGMGEFSRLREDYGRALDFYKQALFINKQIGDAARQTTNLVNLGATAILQNDLESAGDFYREGLIISSKMADMNGTLYCLEGLAGAYWSHRKPEQSALLFGAAEASRQTYNLLLEPTDRVPYEKSVQLVRDLLPEKTFTKFRAIGHELKLDEAVAAAIEG